jgi:hypothetical protein
MGDRCHISSHSDRASAAVSELQVNGACGTWTGSDRTSETFDAMKHRQALMSLHQEIREINWKTRMIKINPLIIKDMTAIVSTVS